MWDEILKSGVSELVYARAFIIKAHPQIPRFCITLPVFTPSDGFRPSLPLIYFYSCVLAMARRTRRSHSGQSNEDHTVLQGPGSNDMDHSVEHVKDTTKGAIPDAILSKSNHQKQGRNVPSPQMIPTPVRIQPQARSLPESAATPELRPEPQRGGRGLDRLVRQLNIL